MSGFSELKQMQADREWLHQNPELSFEEFETANFIRKRLEALGVRYEVIAKTGTVALFGSIGESSALGIRADIDALPIQEESSAIYASKVKGKMHACGHDVHTSMALGLCTFLSQTYSESERPIVVLFQPAEELLPGGASIVIEEGFIQKYRIGKMLAFHVYPEFSVGSIGIRPGPYMASTDELRVVCKGKGGHGAMPHSTIDTVYMASSFVVQVQQIVSRNINPVQNAVISFGRIEGLGATNVIPSEVCLEGTMRTFSKSDRELIYNRLQVVAESIGAMCGGEIEIQISKGYPPLINDSELCSKVQNILNSELTGVQQLELPLRMTAEDFAFYAEHVPICFMRLGTASSNGQNTFGVHNSKFDIDIDAMQVGLDAWKALSLNWSQYKF